MFRENEYCFFRCWIPKNMVPVGIYLLKVNNRNTRTRCEIFSKLVFPLLNLNMQMPAGMFCYGLRWLTNFRNTFHFSENSFSFFFYFLLSSKGNFFFLAYYFIFNAFCFYDITITKLLCIIYYIIITVLVAIITFTAVFIKFHMKKFRSSRS